MAVDVRPSLDKLEELTTFYLNFERVGGFHKQGMQDSDFIRWD